MSGTHVSANQGGCTAWCDDCGEAHNCESWKEDKTLDWLKSHAKTCSAARKRRIDEALRGLSEGDLPAALLKEIKRHATALGKKS